MSAVRLSGTIETRNVDNETHRMYINHVNSMLLKINVRYADESTAAQVQRLFFSVENTAADEARV